VHESPGNPQVIHFGDFEADLRARELCKNGARVRLQDQPFQILALLLERAGDVVTRDEMRQKIWPSSVFVDFDHGLNNAIARLREALGDTAGTPQFIETLPRVGYRFIFPLADSRPAVDPTTTVESPPPNSRPAKRQVGIAIAAIVIVATVLLGSWIVHGTRGSSRELRASAGEASIAVLPFVNMSSDAENGYFADGLTEELTQKLAGIRGLRVAGRTSAFVFKDHPESTAAMAKALGVNHLLEGSVRRSGTRIRITAQLLDARDGYHLWSQTFDRNDADIFKIQEDIALAVASAMQIKLVSTETARLHHRGTQDAEAYRLYVVGMAYLRGLTITRDLERAKALFEAALARDPKFAEAHAGIAQYHFKRAFNSLGDIDRGAQLGLAAAERAITLNPDSSEALEAQANVQAVQYRYRGDFSAYVQAQGAFRHAIEIDPSNSLALFDYGRAVLWHDPDLAKSLFDRALEIEPLARGAQNMTATILGMKSEVQAARTQCASWEKQSVGDNELCTMVIAAVEGSFGNLDRSVVLLRRLRRSDVGLSIQLWGGYLSLGDEAAARHALDFGPSEGGKALAAAAALAMDGRYEDAFQLLERQRHNFEFIRILDLPAARMALIAGKPQQALTILRGRLPDLESGMEPVDARNVMPALDLATALSGSGQAAAARQLLARIAAYLSGSTVLRMPVFEYQRARMHALAGEPDLAFQALDRAYEAGFRTTWAVDLNPQPLLYIDPLKADPCFSLLRTDARLARWFARIAADNARQRERLRVQDASPAKT
jgi:TolB-like protein/DNA-binding winged helix-turn-helix (wHTH) protein